MNQDYLDDTLYDQDIGVEIRIEPTEIKYELATNIEEIIKEPKNEEIIEKKEEIKYEPVTSIEEVSKPKEEILDINLNKELREIEKENVLTKKNSEKKQEIQEKPVLKEEKNQKVKEKSVVKKEKKSRKKAKNNKKTNNSYVDGSTYLIVLAIIISFITIFLILSGKQNFAKDITIKLVGEETIILELNEQYKEPGFVAVDYSRGDVSKKVDVQNNVDTSKAGIYEINYLLSDTKIKVTRHVIVQNKNDIEFKLKGDSIIFSKFNSEFIEDGYIASYNDQDYSNEVQKFGDVDLNKPGLYKIYYAINIDGKVKALTRNVVVYAGEIIDNNDELSKEINNYLVDEIHYSNLINIDNVNPSVLLYFGALNCKDNLEIDELNSCLNKLFKDKNITLKNNVKYEGNNASIAFDKKENKFIIKKLELPRTTENLHKVIIEGDNAYVYEKYAYRVLINNKEICDGKTKAILYSAVDRSLKTGYETCTKACEQCEITRTRNYQETLYIHTFKKVNDKYVWNSTEMIK